MVNNFLQNFWCLFVHMMCLFVHMMCLSSILNTSPVTDTPLEVGLWVSLYKCVYRSYFAMVFGGMVGGWGRGIGTCVSAGTRVGFVSFWEISIIQDKHSGTSQSNQSQQKKSTQSIHDGNQFETHKTH